MKASDVLTAVYGHADVWPQREPGPHGIERWTDPLEVFQAIRREELILDYLEVGSWLGGSADRAAEAFPELESLICVDTWFGAAEHWTDSENPSHNLHRDYLGQPRIYERFLQNMIHLSLHGVVAPIRQTSLIAAEILSYHDIAADLVYIDGSHSYRDVLADCRAYWPLTRRFLMGDDWGDKRFGVAAGVLDFMRLEKVDPATLQIFGGNFWLIDKGP